MSDNLERDSFGRAYPGQRPYPHKNRTPMPDVIKPPAMDDRSGTKGGRLISFLFFAASEAGVDLSGARYTKLFAWVSENAPNFANDIRPLVSTELRNNQ